jgi:hypothetical protein
MKLLKLNYRGALMAKPKTVFPLFLNPVSVKVGDRFGVVKNNHIFEIVAYSKLSVGKEYTYRFELKDGSLHPTNYFLSAQRIKKDIKDGRLKRL